MDTTYTLADMVVGIEAFLDKGLDRQVSKNVRAIRGKPLKTYGVNGRDTQISKR